MSTRTPRDMMLSIGVLLVPVVIIVALFRFFGNEKVQVVDPGPALDQARVAAAFPVASPAGLPDGWRPVSAGFRRADGGATLRIGYLTPSKAGVQLIESSEPLETLVQRELGGSARPRGEVAVGDRSWQFLQVRGEESALMLAEPDRTVLIVGRAEQDELTVLASSLR